MEPLILNRSTGERFADRSEAGKLLAERIRHRKLSEPIILALPRGGVPAAYEVARRLDIPMDVLVARKVGAPGDPEFAIGAVVEGGFYHLNGEAIAALHLTENQAERALEHERREIRRRIALYRLDRSLPSVKNRDVLLIDDGIATGETARVACRLLRSRGARRTIIAVPVCPSRLKLEEDFPEADELIVLQRVEKFRGVEQSYVRFNEVGDEAVVHLTERAREFGRTPFNTN